MKANGYLDVSPQNNAVISTMITGYVRKKIFGLETFGKGQTVAEPESMDELTLADDFVIDGAFYLLNAFTEGE